MIVPNAESPEFSRLCDMEETDGDFEPVEGGLKNEAGSFRILYGTVRGRIPSGLRTFAKMASNSVAESLSILTNFSPLEDSPSDMMATAE